MSIKNKRRRGRPPQLNGEQGQDVCALLLTNVPRRVRDHFKAECARRGLNMTETLIDYMRTVARVPVAVPTTGKTD